MSLTPSAKDPKRKEELKRKESQPGSFGVGRSGVRNAGQHLGSVDTRSDSKKVADAKKNLKECQDELATVRSERDDALVASANASELAVNLANDIVEVAGDVPSELVAKAGQVIADLTPEPEGE